MPLDFSAFGFTPENLDEAGKYNRADIEAYYPEIVQIREDCQIPAHWTDLELWENYSDERLYELDKAVRQYIQSMRTHSKNRKGYKTSADLVFAWIFGRPCEPKDGATTRTIHKLLNYYCTKVTGQSNMRGKKVTKVYHFSTYGGVHKRPMSVRLRMEEEYRKNGRYVNFLTFSPLQSGDPKEVSPVRVKGDGGPTDRGDGSDEDEGLLHDRGGDAPEDGVADPR